MKYFLRSLCVTLFFVCPSLVSQSFGAEKVFSVKNLPIPFSKPDANPYGYGFYQNCMNGDMKTVIPCECDEEISKKITASGLFSDQKLQPNCRIDKKGLTFLIEKKLYTPHFTKQFGDDHKNAKLFIECNLSRSLIHMLESESRGRVFPSSQQLNFNTSSYLPKQLQSQLNTLKGCKGLHPIPGGYQAPSPPTSYPDPFLNYASNFTDWKYNPNGSPDFLDDIKVYLEPIYTAWSLQLQKNKNLEAMGIYIGQDLKDVYSLYDFEQLRQYIQFPSVVLWGEKVGPAGPKQLLESVYPYHGWDFDNRRLPANNTLSSEEVIKLKAENELPDKFLGLYRTVNDEKNSEFSRAFSLIQKSSGGSVFPLKWPGKRGLGENAMLKNKNIVSLELHTNIFQQVTGFEISRQFDSLIDLGSLSRKVEQKYSDLIEKRVDESISSISFELKDKTGFIFLSQGDGKTKIYYRMYGMALGEKAFNSAAKKKVGPLLQEYIEQAGNEVVSADDVML